MGTTNKNDDSEGICRHEAGISNDIHPIWEKTFQPLYFICQLLIQYSNVDSQFFLTFSLHVRESCA